MPATSDVFSYTTAASITPSSLSFNSISSTSSEVKVVDGAVVPPTLLSLASPATVPSIYSSLSVPSNSNGTPREFAPNSLSFASSHSSAPLDVQSTLSTRLSVPIDEVSTSVSELLLQEAPISSTFTGYLTAPILSSEHVSNLPISSSLLVSPSISSSESVSIAFDPSSLTSFPPIAFAPSIAPSPLVSSTSITFSPLVSTSTTSSPLASPFIDLYSEGASTSPIPHPSPLSQNGSASSSCLPSNFSGSFSIHLPIPSASLSTETLTPATSISAQTSSALPLPGYSVIPSVPSDTNSILSAEAVVHPVTTVSPVDISSFVSEFLPSMTSEWRNAAVEEPSLAVNSDTISANLKTRTLRVRPQRETKKKTFFSNEYAREWSLPSSKDVNGVENGSYTGAPSESTNHRMGKRSGTTRGKARGGRGLSRKFSVSPVSSKRASSAHGHAGYPSADFSNNTPPSGRSPKIEASAAHLSGTTVANSPRHPMVPAGTPMWIKYGEEHYPEEVTPPDYRWIEMDGTVCSYITDFLLYNKKGERLLPVESLDKDEAVDIVLYGKLVHVALVHPPEMIRLNGHPCAAIYAPPSRLRRPYKLSKTAPKKLPESLVNADITFEKSVSHSPQGEVLIESLEEIPVNTYSETRAESPSPSNISPEAITTSSSSQAVLTPPSSSSPASLSQSVSSPPPQGGRLVTSGSGLSSLPTEPKVPKNQRTFPIRVDLAEWCIDYGHEPSTIPYIWLISRQDIYYRLEKPAGRYIPLFSSLKLKFEISCRIIKSLQRDPDSSFNSLMNALTLNERLKAYQRQQDGSKDSPLVKFQEKEASTFSLNRDEKEGVAPTFEQSVPDDSLPSESLARYTFASPEDEEECWPQRSIPVSEGHHKLTNKNLLALANLYNKKNKNYKIRSLSEPEGTGVLIFCDGKPSEQLFSPWGAPLPVQGCTKEVLYSLYPFIESQVQNFVNGFHISGLLETTFLKELKTHAMAHAAMLQSSEAAPLEEEGLSSTEEPVEKKAYATLLMLNQVLLSANTSLTAVSLQEASKDKKNLDRSLVKRGGRGIPRGRRGGAGVRKRGGSMLLASLGGIKGEKETLNNLFRRKLQQENLHSEVEGLDETMEGEMQYQALPENVWDIQSMDIRDFTFEEVPPLLSPVARCDELYVGIADRKYFMQPLPLVSLFAYKHDDILEIWRFLRSYRELFELDNPTLYAVERALMDIPPTTFPTCSPSFKPPTVWHFPSVSLPEDVPLLYHPEKRKISVSISPLNAPAALSSSSLEEVGSTSSIPPPLEKIFSQEEREKEDGSEFPPHKKRKKLSPLERNIGDASTSSANISEVSIPPTIPLISSEPLPETMVTPSWMEENFSELIPTFLINRLHTNLLRVACLSIQSLEVEKVALPFSSKLKRTLIDSLSALTMLNGKENPYIVCPSSPTEAIPSISVWMGISLVPFSSSALSKSQQEGSSVSSLPPSPSLSIGLPPVKSSTDTNSLIEDHAHKRSTILNTKGGIEKGIAASTHSPQFKHGKRLHTSLRSTDNALRGEPSTETLLPPFYILDTMRFDLRFLDDVTWPLFVKRLLFDCLYSPCHYSPGAENNEPKNSTKENSPEKPLRTEPSFSVPELPLPSSTVSEDFPPTTESAPLASTAEVDPPSSPRMVNPSPSLEENGFWLPSQKTEVSSPSVIPESPVLQEDSAMTLKEPNGVFSTCLDESSSVLNKEDWVFSRNEEHAAIKKSERVIHESKAWLEPQDEETIAFKNTHTLHANESKAALSLEVNGQTPSCIEDVLPGLKEAEVLPPLSSVPVEASAAVLSSTHSPFAPFSNGSIENTNRSPCLERGAHVDFLTASGNNDLTPDDDRKEATAESFTAVQNDGSSNDMVQHEGEVCSAVVMEGNPPLSTSSLPSTLPISPSPPLSPALTSTEVEALTKTHPLFSESSIPPSEGVGDDDLMEGVEAPPDTKKGFSASDIHEGFLEYETRYRGRMDPREGFQAPLKWVKDEKRAFSKGISSQQFQKLVDIFMRFRCCGHHQLPEEYRVALVKWLLNIIAEGSVGKAFMDAKMEAFYTARTNALKLKLMHREQNSSGDLPETFPVSSEAGDAIEAMMNITDGGVTAEAEVSEGGSAHLHRSHQRCSVSPPSTTIDPEEEDPTNPPLPCFLPPASTTDLISPSPLPCSVSEECLEASSATTTVTKRFKKKLGGKGTGRVSNSVLTELAAHFPVRSEFLGEDRFFNRYYYFGEALGCPRIFVEYLASSHIDPPCLIDPLSTLPCKRSISHTESSRSSPNALLFSDGGQHEITPPVLNHALGGRSGVKRKATPWMMDEGKRLSMGKGRNFINDGLNARGVISPFIHPVGLETEHLSLLAIRSAAVAYASYPSLGPERSVWATTALTSLDLSHCQFYSRSQSRGGLYEGISTRLPTPFSLSRGKRGGYKTSLLGESKRGGKGLGTGGGRLRASRARWGSSARPRGLSTSAFPLAGLSGRSLNLRGGVASAGGIEGWRPGRSRGRGRKDISSCRKTRLVDDTNSLSLQTYGNMRGGSYSRNGRGRTLRTGRGSGGSSKLVSPRGGASFYRLSTAHFEEGFARIPQSFSSLQAYVDYLDWAKTHTFWGFMDGWRQMEDWIHCLSPYTFRECELAKRLSEVVELYMKNFTVIEEVYSAPSDVARQCWSLCILVMDLEKCLLKKLWGSSWELQMKPFSRFTLVRCMLESSKWQDTSECRRRCVASISKVLLYLEEWIYNSSMLCVSSWKNLRPSWRRDVTSLMALEQQAPLSMDGVSVQTKERTPLMPEEGRFFQEGDEGDKTSRHPVKGFLNYTTEQGGCIHKKETEEPGRVYLGDCEELVCVLGMYFNFWKIYGLCPQKLQDIQTVVDRETFLSLVESTYRGSIPNKGDRLIYFKGGHRTIIDTMQEYEFALETEIPPSLYYVEEVVVEDIWYHPGKTMATTVPLSKIVSSPKISYSFVEDPIKLGLRSSDLPIDGLKYSSSSIKQEDFFAGGNFASSSNLHLPSEPPDATVKEKEKEGMPYCRLWCKIVSRDASEGLKRLSKTTADAVNDGESFNCPTFYEISKTRASSRIRGQPPPELARELGRSPVKEENWRAVEPCDSVKGERYAMFCLPLKNGFPEFFVSKEKFVSALNLGWKPGMRFKMFFQTEGEKGGARFTGTIRKIDYEAKDLWECVLVEWDDNKKSSKKNLECVNLWELEPIKDTRYINGRLSSKT